MNCRNRVASYKRGNWRLLVKDFKSKPIKEEGKIPNQQFQITLAMKSLMAQQFITTPTFPNLCVSQTLNNIVLVKIINNKKKDWIKKYHKIIWEIEQIVNIQAQLQNIIRLAEEANIQITEIETTILQASDNYWI